MPSTAPLPWVSTTLALKEWSAVVHGLLQGRQVVLLRKGGIHEKAFRLAGAAAFVVFPTVAHSHAERVRPEHRDLLDAGAADVDQAQATFWVRAGLSLVEAVDVRQPERLPDIEDLHIWTAASVQEDRVAFRPKHALQALVVRAYALPEPIELPRLDAYAGCTSWLDLPVPWDGRAGRQIVSEDRLQEVAERVRETVG
jgi:hypothetical protein